MVLVDHIVILFTCCNTFGHILYISKSAATKMYDHLKLKEENLQFMKRKFKQ